MAASEGTIKRIALENFVTYDSVECVPGENLNVIIGPNGTGKSSVVSAIMLGLGEKPSLTGRGKKAQEFIKTGCDEAKITIELNPDHVVERRIFKDGKTAYKLNGHIATLSEVSEFVKKLNIQVGNLCQFLPQDRVSEFAQMNKKDLLVSTERAVGGDQMVKQHEDLIQMQLKLQQLQTELTVLEKELAVKKEQNERLDVNVRTITERNNLLEEIENFKRKLVWLQYEKAREEYLAAREACAPIKEVLNSAKRAFDPIEAEKIELEKKSQDHKVKRKNTIRNFDIAVTSLKEELEATQDTFSRMEHIEREHKKNVQREAMRAQQKEVLKQYIEDRTRAIADMEGTQAENKRRADAISKDLEQYQKRVIELERKVREIKVGASQLEHDRQALQFSLRAAENSREQIRKHLRRVNADAHAGVEWIEANKHRFKEMFKGAVYLPLMLEVNVTDQRCTNYVEHSIGQKDLVAFSCELNEDVNRLTTELRMKLKLKVNILSLEVNEPGSQRFSVDQIKHFGFDGFLDSYISAPPAIARYLKTAKGFHNIPVSHQQISQDLPREITKYYTAGSVVQVSFSRYSNESVVSESQVRPAYYLQFSREAPDLQNEKQSLREKEAELEEVHGRIKAHEVEMTRLNDVCAQKRTERNELQRSGVDINREKFTIRQKETELQDLERQSRDLADEKANLKKQLEDLLRKGLKKHVSTRKLYEGLRKRQRDMMLSKLEDAVTTKKLAVVLTTHQHHQQKVEAAQAEYGRAEAEVVGSRQLAKNLFEVAKRGTNNCSLNDPGFEPFSLIFRTLPNTIGEVEELIDNKTAAVACKSDVDDSVLREYQDRAKEIEQLNKNIRAKTTRRDELKNQMTSWRDKWLFDLRILVRKISVNFSRYYKEIQCAGDVVLQPGEDEHDYKNYALSIQVSYRENGQLQELDHLKQSGGERAVATALFMISLQELTRVPFRCVDEINQGMDEINERRVYKLLMTITGGENTSQYFLFTPKLLKDIDFADSSRIHCVFNGHRAIQYRKWKLSGFREKQKRRRRRMNVD